eukprot:c11780_g1_i2.p1 GENE.c11780_g1_i2~~c11780_g1_i2.p1  ORF type:complete len:344 (+),score=75.28 c11780_g1_i2:133-1164(+)
MTTLAFLESTFQKCCFGFSNIFPQHNKPFYQQKHTDCPVNQSPVSELLAHLSKMPPQDFNPPPLLLHRAHSPHDCGGVIRPALSLTQHSQTATDPNTITSPINHNHNLNLNSTSNTTHSDSTTSHITHGNHNNTHSHSHNNGSNNNNNNGISASGGPSVAGHHPGCLCTCHLHPPPNTILSQSIPTITSNSSNGNNNASSSALRTLSTTASILHQVSTPSIATAFATTMATQIAATVSTQSLLAIASASQNQQQQNPTIHSSGVLGAQQQQTNEATHVAVEPESRGEEGTDHNNNLANNTGTNTSIFNANTNNGAIYSLIDERVQQFCDRLKEFLSRELRSLV